MHSMLIRPWLPLIVLAVAGCQGQTATTSGVGRDITGTWSGSMTSSVIKSGAIPNSVTVTMNLTKAGDGSNGIVISGVVSVSDTVLKLNCYTGGVISSDDSSMVGDSVRITFTDGNGATVVFSGTLSGDTISGVYSASSLTCTEAVDKADSGSLTLTLVGG